MIQECCKKMGKLGSKLLIYPKREFFLKNNYHYLCLSSTPKLGPNCPFASLWQNWLLLLSAYCILSCYSISKKSWTSNSRDRRCAEGWPKLGPSYFPKRNIFANFLETLTNIALVELLYLIMLCHFKKIATVLIMWRLHNFYLNCP